MNRGDYRRQLKIDEKFVAKGLDTGEIDPDQIVSLMRVIRDRLRTCISRSSITSLMYCLYQNMNHGEKHIADVPIACKKGCSHCCNIWVDATPPEIFYTANAIRSQKQHVNALASVEGAIATTGGLSFDDRGDMVTPCPLLSENLCGVYEARPINCRTAVSADAAVCERSYLHVSGEDIPAPFVWMALRQGYGFALVGALHHAGLVPHAVEWNEALRIALAEPDAEAQWLAGEDVFANVGRATDEPLVQHPQLRAIYQEAFGVAP